MDQIKDKFNEVSQPAMVRGLELSTANGRMRSAQFGGQRFSTSDICKPLGVRDLWSHVISFLTGLYIWRSCRDAPVYVLWEVSLPRSHIANGPELFATA